MSQNKNKKVKKKRSMRFLWIFLLILLGANFLIVFTGRTYLYKGIAETYLKGKTGPGIYDSLVFPVRIAQHSLTPEKWNERDPLIKLNQHERELLKATETSSFLIVKNDEVILEFYDLEHSENVKSNSFSMAKSFIGLMIGIAIDNHKIKSFDSPISNYLPFRLPNDENVTIRDLLGMSSGLDWSESGKNPFSDNAEAYYTTHLTEMLEKKSFIIEPDKKFEYKSGNSQLLGIILQNATGKHPTEYFEEKVWSKIGTEHDLYWSLDRENGEEKTFCCGYATTRDYAKIGQLILNKGKWNGTEIISSKTLAEIISPYSSETPFYGLHFWLFNHPKYPAVYLRGILGQYVIVIPSIDVVIVRTGHKREEVYAIPEDKKEDKEFVKENKYKERHPLDLIDYYSILDSVLSE